MIECAAAIMLHVFLQPKVVVIKAFTQSDGERARGTPLHQPGLAKPHLPRPVGGEKPDWVEQLLVRVLGGGYRTTDISEPGTKTVSTSALLEVLHQEM